MGTTTTVHSFMAEDHDRLDHIFSEFTNIRHTDQAGAEKFREFELGLQQHIMWEEEVLFPLFEHKTGLHAAGPTVVMRVEHRIIKDFLEKIHRGLDRNIKTDDFEQGLIKALTEHNHKEELILYPWLDNSLSAEGKRTAFVKMRQLRAPS